MTHPDLDTIAGRAIAQLRSAAPDLDWTENAIARCRRVAIASDFAIAVLAQQPRLLAALLADDAADALPVPQLTAANRHDWPMLLRRHRTAESTRLVWRDVDGLDDVETTLTGSTLLADTCMEAALLAPKADSPSATARARRRRHAQRMVVFALGKLGGGELNFSSDIDLVYALRRRRQKRRRARLDAEDYFARLGQQLARLLDEPTPTATASRRSAPASVRQCRPRRAVVLRHGTVLPARRPRLGTLRLDQGAAGGGRPAAGEELLETLRPFVFRRYLDYGALDGLREMKAAIAAEVARKDLADDIKLGPGGIREIEFLAQALQLIRGGREPALRERRLLPALHALRAAGSSVGAGRRRARAYRFLRRLENRVQMLGDQQAHALPARSARAPAHRARAGYRDWDALTTSSIGTAAGQRGIRRVDGAAPRRCRDERPVDVLARIAGGGRRRRAGASRIRAARRRRRRPARFRCVARRARPVRCRARAARPRAAGAARRDGGVRQPLLALRRLLGLLQTILRRASYLALLDEQPAALTRLVDVVSRSALLAERLAAHPLLLDELLDARVAGALPQRDALPPACAGALVHDDIEAALLALNETRQSLSFRIALALLDGRQPARDSARQLAWLADAVIEVVVALALREMQAAHGGIAASRFAVIAYGSLGGEELGFGSDLDLVFLYDAPAGETRRRAPARRAALVRAPGAEDRRLLARPAPAGAFTKSTCACARMAAKACWCRAGELRRLPARTRLDLGTPGAGARALRRRRCRLVRAFERVRTETLARDRDADKVRDDIVAMRAKMRAELDRSDARASISSKARAGWSTSSSCCSTWCCAMPPMARGLLVPRDTPALIAAAGDAGAIAADASQALLEAHATLLSAGLDCTLDRRQRLVIETDAISGARAAIRRAAQEVGSGVLRLDVCPRFPPSQSSPAARGRG